MHAYLTDKLTAEELPAVATAADAVAAPDAEDACTLLERGIALQRLADARQGAIFRVELGLGVVAYFIARTPAQVTRRIRLAVRR